MHMWNMITMLFYMVLSRSKRMSLSVPSFLALKVICIDWFMQL